MQTTSKVAEIRVRGAREGALCGVDIDLPLGALICLLGRSGSGHRDLAVRVLCAESRSRYMRVLSPFEREGQVGAFRVDVDEVSGLPPAICYRERDAIPPGTVAAFLALDGLLARLVLERGDISCPHCGAPCRAYAADEVESEVFRLFGERRCLVLAPFSIAADSAGDLVLAELRRAGFVRVRIERELYRLDGELPELKGDEKEIEVVVDRLRAGGKDHRRFLEAVRSARAISRGMALFVTEEGASLLLNQQLTCSGCAIQYEDLALDDLIGAEEHALAAGVRWQGQTYADLLALPVRRLKEMVVEAKLQDVEESRSLLEALDGLCDLGLGMLALEHRLVQLSRGEWHRLRLASCLGTGLAGILYCFEGMVSAVHPQQRAAVLTGLRKLVQMGNTLVVLDAAEELLAAADRVWECAEGQVRPWSPLSLPGRAVRPAGEMASMWLLQGDGDWGTVDLSLPRGRIIGITGLSAVGKTRFLDEVVEKALRGKSRAYQAVQQRGSVRVHRIEYALRKRTLLGELGAFARIAQLYAQTPAGMERSLPPDFFNLEKPGGRCPACEGRGRIHLAVEYLDDVELPCPTCEGRRYREGMLDISYRGINIAEVLDMDVVRGRAHFARDSRLYAQLGAVVECGLGHLHLGQCVGDLEWGETLRLQLALVSARASARDFVLIDHAYRGEHPLEVHAFMNVLTRLSAKDVSVLVAAHHSQVLGGCDVILQIVADGAKGRCRAHVLKGK